MIYTIGIAVLCVLAIYIYFFIIAPDTSTTSALKYIRNPGSKNFTGNFNVLLAIEASPLVLDFKDFKLTNFSTKGITLLDTELKNTNSFSFSPKNTDYQYPFVYGVQRFKGAIKYYTSNDEIQLFTLYKVKVTSGSTETMLKISNNGDLYETSNPSVTFGTYKGDIIDTSYGLLAYYISDIKGLTITGDSITASNPATVVAEKVTLIDKSECTNANNIKIGCYCINPCL